ncbi:histidine kinase [Kribbella pratensis]|uniref:histidine kinase n=1 Tax=Kribbella pratensis TaxID=2512112 RepID=A0ABY2F813_9ACTN|nr:sensor histidine kinase [Kribbella pratensis]TDW84523.1 histidine kinase [Kribbella pratensis]
MTTSRNRRGLAAALAALVVAEVVFAVAYGVSIGWGWRELVDSFSVTNGLMGLTFGLCGAVIAWHRPANPIGWLFLADGIGHATTPFADTLAYVVHGEFAQRVLVTVSMAAWPWSIGLFLPLALLLFPDGRLLSPRWRWAAIGIIVTAPLFVLEMIGSGEAISPDLPLGLVTVPNFDALQPLWTATEVRNLAALLLALICLGIRYRRADEAGRRQLLWLLLASVIALLFVVPWAFVAGTPILVLLAIPLIPIAVAVAIVRYQLLDIRLVVSRALTWALLSLVAIGIYAALVALLDSLIASQVGRSAAVTVFVALVIAPVLPRLQQLVDRALYGDRHDPARVASRVGEQLSAGLPGVVAAIRSALRLPYAALIVDGQVIAASPTTTDRTATDSSTQTNGSAPDVRAIPSGPAADSSGHADGSTVDRGGHADGSTVDHSGHADGSTVDHSGHADGSTVDHSGHADGAAVHRSGYAGGSGGGSVVPLELSYGGEVVGTLEVGVRSGESGLSSADRSVLGLVAVPLAVALHATRLSAELQSSREKLVSAREEERRRLRRDLHDGLGPTLTGVAFSADAAANLITTDTPQAVELLARLRSDTRSAIADVRRLVEDLRPPALDELGLVGALRQRADQLSFRADGARLQVEVAAEGLPRLPAALEVAAYRIATEALTNVVRHSRATSAVLTLRCGTALEIEVTDDGPPGENWRPGVGIQAMNERAAELGGTFEAGPTAHGGLVRAVFPLPTSTTDTPPHSRDAIPAQTPAASDTDSPAAPSTTGTPAAHASAEAGASAARTPAAHASADGPAEADASAARTPAAHASADAPADPDATRPPAARSSTDAPAGPSPAVPSAEASSLELR